MISEQDVQAYKRDGVIVVPEILGADTLTQLRSVIAELVAGAAKTLEHTDVYDLEPGHTAESPRVRRIKTPHKVHALFDQIVRSPAVLDILKKLIGPGLRLHGSKLNMKSAHYGSPVEWHQDWAFYPHTNDDILPCMGRAGSMSFHHVRALHGSAMNTSDRPRNLLLYEVAASDAWPLMGVKDFAEFNSRLLTGDPVVAPRMTNVPVRLPLPPATRQGSIYETQSAAKKSYFTRAA